LPESDLALLIDAAHAAGHVAARFWRQSPRTWTKDDHQGPVSEADYAIDNMLRDTLTAARPDYGWLSEETEDGTARLSARRTFIVDPLDGTRAFLNSDRTFAHSLAVAEEGRVVAGVVFLPLRDKLYTASLGGGAALNGTPIRSGSRSGLDGAELLVAGAAMQPKYWRGHAPQIHRHLRPSLAYRLCLVAEGRFDAMLTIRDSWHWDIAAGALILSEAGAIVTDRLGSAIDFNTAHPVSRGVVAAGPALHGEMLARLT
jgi:myo-inositol-1(or 4)-monophosphatase